MLSTAQSISIYCDGGARGNPGPAASAFVVNDTQGKIIYEQGDRLGVVTNNHAEYQAVIHALNWFSQHTADLPQLKTVSFFLDSLLVVSQINGDYRVKDQNLKNKYSQVWSLLNSLKNNSHIIVEKFSYIPRSQNSRADYLVNQTLDSSIINPANS